MPLISKQCRRVIDFFLRVDF